MKFKKTVKLDTAERLALRATRDVIAGICEEFSNSNCRECPFFATICYNPSNTEFESAFAKVVDILTEGR